MPLSYCIPSATLVCPPQPFGLASTMGRYSTKRYVALSWAEATRLAGLDQTPLTAIRYSAAAVLIHRTEWWAWWSDELLTTAIGLPESCNPQGLSHAAVELITDVWASDSPQPDCRWSLLAQVQHVLLVEPLSQQCTDNLTTWERLLVELSNGQQRPLYRVWVRLGDQYLCQISTELPELLS